MSRVASAQVPPSRRSGHTLGAFRPAKEVGKYRVLAELGRGGMANVFLAVAQGAGAVSKLVVLKALLPDLASEPNSLAMFLDEARLAVLLNHGNVVQTYEVGTEGDRHVIVMEYLEGQSLAAVLRRSEMEGERLPLALHLRVIINVLEGLHYTHELKGYDGMPLQLVHRDVSPQNVFVTYDGRTKVLDFGIAKAATSTTETVTGVVKGKIAYMPPEQLAGESVDRRADVYAVGCMLWCAATGRKLWKDIPDVYILRKVVNGDIPSPKSVNSKCDDELERIVMKALAPDRNRRYSSALELQEDLERYCDRVFAANRPRDLARFVSGLFADTQANLKARIESQLSLADSGVAHTRPEEPVRSLVFNVADAQGQSSTQSISASAVNAPAPGFGLRKRALWLVAAGGLLALVAAVYALKSSQDERPHPADASAAQAVQRSVPQPATVKVDLLASPRDARLYLDDQPLTGNPALRVLPLDGKVHQLRAELAGHHTASAEFAATRDDVVELKLEALKPQPLPQSGAGAPTRKVVRPAAAPNCKQPFFVDSDGIKKVRRGCL
jgi:eukaryotic-like serine/threonine-protein kinase